METTLYQHCTNVVQRCFDVVSTSGTDVVSTLCDVENPTSDFVSFSTLGQRYFNVDPQHWNNVDPQRWNNVDPTLKQRWSDVEMLAVNKNLHRLKSVRNPRFFSPHFLAFGLNTKICSVDLCIRAEFRKMQKRETPNTDSTNFL